MIFSRMFGLLHPCLFRHRGERRLHRMYRASEERRPARPTTGAQIVPRSSRISARPSGKHGGWPRRQLGASYAAG